MAFIAAVTSPGSADFVPEPDRVAVFDNDGTLWTEQPMYAQLAFALDRAAELGHPTSLGQLHAGGMPALTDLLKLTHAGLTTGEFEAACRRWLAAARHPRSGRPYPAMVYQPMLELLGLLGRSGFSCWIFSGGGTDFMRAWAGDVYGLPPHRVIGSVGATEFRLGPHGPELVKSATVQVMNDGPQKPAFHPHPRGPAAHPGGRATPTGTWPCSSGPRPARAGRCSWWCGTPMANASTPTTGTRYWAAGHSGFTPLPPRTGGP